MESTPYVGNGQKFSTKYSPQTPGKLDNNNYCNLPLSFNVICHIILVNVKVTGSFSFHADASSLHLAFNIIFGI